MADQINLKEVWNRPIETLSKGFKRRVGIAQALIHDPDILILDEPTDGLDPNQKHEMRSLIKNISQNKAIVISTHILEEVEAVCSRAIIIADGKLLANEKPEDLGNKFLQTDAVSIKISDKIDKKLINEIKSSLKYKIVNIELNKKNHYEILIEDKKEVLNLNKIMTEIKKYKLNIYEASFLKNSLDDVFRKITQQK
jgi:ABC-2 type transport system ATP-binding protein